tara:strand:+ start:80 stop:541 length:462 start_codon:yes stop_codon:yes gene_type:complete
MKYVVLFPAFVLAGCTFPPFQDVLQTPQVAVVAPIAALPPPDARTVAQFDTTTAEDRAAATAAPTPASETRLSTTIATLGSPFDPGIWLKTPLVTELLLGRVDYSGTSVNLELRPSGGEAGSGSQISLPAMLLLDAPLTGLLDLTVYKTDQPR